MTFFTIVLGYSWGILNILCRLCYTDISRKAFWTFIEATHKSSFILWLHPSSDNSALAAVGHQIPSCISHILMAEATRNNIPDYISSFIDQGSLIYFIPLKSTFFSAFSFQKVQPDKYFPTNSWQSCYKQWSLSSCQLIYQILAFEMEWPSRFFKM